MEAKHIYTWPTRGKKLQTREDREILVIGGTTGLLMVASTSALSSFPSEYCQNTLTSFRPV